jgi:hypothetical protein
LIPDGGIADIRNLSTGPTALACSDVEERLRERSSTCRARIMRRPYGTQSREGHAAQSLHHPLEFNRSIVSHDCRAG